MILHTYRPWLAISFGLHVLLFVGLSLQRFPEETTHESIVPVRFVTEAAPPKVVPVTQPPKAIPPNPKVKTVAVTKVGVPKPVPHHVVTPHEYREPVAATPVTPPKPSPAPPVAKPAAPPAIMTAKNGIGAVPPGKPGGTGQQGTEVAPSGPTYDAAALGGPSPGYPKLAEEDGLEGTVRIVVKVNADGRFTASVAKSSGHSVLDQAALYAMQSWHFKPAMSKGKFTTGTVAVRFTYANGKVEGVAL